MLPNPFKAPKSVPAMMVLLLFSFAHLYGQKITDPPTSDRIMSSSVLKSDSIPESSIVLIKATYNKIPGEGEDPLFHLEYTNYPICQIRPLDFAALIVNTDTVELTGVYLKVDISNQYSYSETFNSETIGIAPGDTTMLVIPDYTPPSEEGNYEILYTIYWDQQDSTQLVSTTRSFGVNAIDPDAYIYMGNSIFINPTVFSRDNGEMIASTSDVGTGETFMAGLIYTFTGNDEICCLGAQFGYDTESNTFARFQIRDTEGFYFLSETEMFSPPSNPFGGGSFLWAAFEDPIPAAAMGLNYRWLVNVIVYNLDASMVSVGISSHDGPDSSAYIFGVFGDTDCTAGCPTNDLYMIRVGMSEAFCTTTVAEVAENVSDFFCAPNPVNGPFTVHYTLSEQADIQFFLFDNMGRVVAQQNPGNQLSGKHILYSDASRLAAGVYTATLVANGKAISKKVVIQ